MALTVDSGFLFLVEWVEKGEGIPALAEKRFRAAGCCGGIDCFNCLMFMLKRCSIQLGYG